MQCTPVYEHLASFFGPILCTDTVLFLFELRLIEGCPPRSFHCGGMGIVHERAPHGEPLSTTNLQMDRIDLVEDVVPTVQLNQQPPCRSATSQRSLLKK